MRTLFKAAVNGKQAAILAPTTILADQHYKNITKRFSSFPFSVGALSRFQSPKEQRETIAKLRARHDRCGRGHAPATLQGY
ncbi:MAG: hypothetical protein U0517_00900 [Candidatus Andersenbacteria bacterium]